LLPLSIGEADSGSVKDVARRLSLFDAQISVGFQQMDAVMAFVDAERGAESGGSGEEVLEAGCLRSKGAHSVDSRDGLSGSDEDGGALALR